jgi:Raf kinase inhibitor-like YbhB/YbcL family protein
MLLTSPRTLAAIAAALGSVLFLVTLLAGCGEDSPEAASEDYPSFTLRSPAFANGAPIPVKYTCDGGELSPPLEWRDVPDGTVTLALIVDDPDAEFVTGQVWDHWVLYNVPVRATSLAENVPTVKDLPGGAHNGRGTARMGYQGPCPPQGRTHTYVFTMYAVDAMIDLPGGATREQLTEALAGHILGVARLTGTYKRQMRR